MNINKFWKRGRYRLTSALGGKRADAHASNDGRAADLVGRLNAAITTHGIHANTQESGVSITHGSLGIFDGGHGLGFPFAFALTFALLAFSFAFWALVRKGALVAHLAIACCPRTANRLATLATAPTFGGRSARTAAGPAAELLTNLLQLALLRRCAHSMLVGTL